MWSKQDLIGDRLDFIHKGDIFGLENRFLVGIDISKMNLKRDISPSSIFHQTLQLICIIQIKRYLEIDLDIEKKKLI